MLALKLFVTATLTAWAVTTYTPKTTFKKKKEKKKETASTYNLQLNIIFLYVCKFIFYL